MNIEEKVVGLRKDWKWIQPKTRAELLQRLAEARDYAVNERERENLCSCAHLEITQLSAAATALHDLLEVIGSDDKQYPFIAQMAREALKNVGR